MDSPTEPSSAPDTNQRAPARSRNPLRRHPLVWYFILAFTGSWLFEALSLASPPFHLHADWWMYPLTFVGPTAAAFIMSAISGGRAEVVTLLRRYIQVRAGVHWYLLALLGIPALVLLSMLTLPGAPAALRLPPASSLLVYGRSYVSTFLFFGPLGEEPGWRGFALPRLQQAHGPLVGSLVLGLFWALWHLPLFFVIPGYNGAGPTLAESLRAFGVFVLFVAGATVLFTWIFNATGGSLICVMLAHASLNTSFDLSFVFPPSFANLDWVQGAASIGLGLIMLAVALLLLELTRGQLGYANRSARG